jgi:hypothetical protein
MEKDILNFMKVKKMREYEKKENNECEKELNNLENFFNVSLETVEIIIQLKIHEDYF